MNSEELKRIDFIIKRLEKLSPIVCAEAIAEIRRLQQLANYNVDAADAYKVEVERLRGPVRTSDALDWSLTADEISKQYRAMAIDHDRLKAAIGVAMENANKQLDIASECRAELEKEQKRLDYSMNHGVIKSSIGITWFDALGTPNMVMTDNPRAEIDKLMGV